MGGSQATSSQNGAIRFTGATDVNYKAPASTELVLSAKSLMGRRYESCSSIKLPDLFMQK